MIKITCCFKILIIHLYVPGMHIEIMMNTVQNNACHRWKETKDAQAP